MHAAQPELLHQPLDPLVADPMAGLAELGMDAADAVATLVLIEQGRDEPAQREVAALAGADRPGPPGVEPRARDLKQVAHEHDGEGLLGSLGVDEDELH